MSPYFSCGVGAVYFFPYVPIRAGIEFKGGFVDAGGKLLFYPGILPSPEIRGGFKIDF